MSKLNYDERNKIEKAAHALIDGVVDAGSAMKFWTPVPDKQDVGRVVRDGGGILFRISAGGWCHEDKLHCSIAAIREGSHLIGAHDVRHYNEEIPSASATYKRGAEAIAKDFNRRMVTNPAARSIGLRMQALLESRIESRKVLVEHAEAMLKLGFRIYGDFTSTCSSVSLYKDGLGVVGLTAKGAVTIERITVDIDKVADLLKVLGLRE